MGDAHDHDTTRRPFGEAVQDHYSEFAGHCYGCGRLNEDGLHVRSFPEGDEMVAHFRPRPYHTALPGLVYGGLIASLIDCQSTGTAAWAIYRSEGRHFDSDPPVRCVTASLHVDYVRPTPIDADLELRSSVVELKGRKVVVSTSLRARGEECARGHVIAIRILEESPPTAG